MSFNNCYHRKSVIVFNKKIPIKNFHSKEREWKEGKCFPFSILFKKISQHSLSNHKISPHLLNLQSFAHFHRPDSTLQGGILKFPFSVCSFLYFGTVWCEKVSNNKKKVNRI